MLSYKKQSKLKKKGHMISWKITYNSIFIFKYNIPTKIAISK